VGWSAFLLGVFVGAPLVASVLLRLVPAPALVPISTATIVTQVVLVAGTWLVLAYVPTYQGSTQDCPDLDTGAGAVLSAAAFVSPIVAAFACASSVMAYNRKIGGAGRWWLGIASEGLVLAIWVPWFFTALCGIS
jgi:hypothetical protein